MSMAVTEVMRSSRASWPRAHVEQGAMVTLALAMQRATGFDSVAMPFCMTVEAEAFGAEVDLGDERTQPRVRGVVLPSDGSGTLRSPDFTRGRAAVLIEAIRRARELQPELPVIGNLVGPFSLLGMLADPLMVLRWTRRRPEIVRAYLEELTPALIAFGRMQFEAGARVICVADPTATGEILGGRLFGEFALPALARVSRALREIGAKVIVHICGKVAQIEGELFALDADAVSFDSSADILAIARKNPRWLAMGNVDAFLLRAGPEEKIAAVCRRLVAGGIRLLAPACGIVPDTPVSHLVAMREATD
jgi:[methyl-Co(III) methanol-specific corrinoid protein]:coenzyme M methyltransferase